MVAITVILFVEFFIEVPASYRFVTDELQSFTVVLAAFAMALGSFSILELHGKRVRNRGEGWQYSIVLICCLALLIGVGLYGGTSGFWFKWFYRYFVQEPSSTIYAIIGWVCVYSIYISFRIDSLEIFYFTLVWIIAFLANAPIGPVLWKDFPILQSWLQSVPNTAATRGYYIANSLSAIAIGFRTIIGRTRVGLE
jgi:hypothetical protein